MIDLLPISMNYRGISNTTSEQEEGSLQISKSIILQLLFPLLSQESGTGEPQGLLLL